jgi:hypothetical protein
MVEIDDREYRVHRLAWAHVYGKWPDGHLDHADLDRSNNALDNLRPATRAQNNANRPLPRNNTSGFKGVHFDKGSRRWIAVCGRRHVGSFATKEEAYAAYVEAARLRYGDFARVA